VGVPKLPAVLVEGGPEQIRVDDTPAGPVLEIGSRLEKVETRELAFRIARAHARVRLHHTVWLRIDPGSLGRTISAILSVTCQSYIPPSRGPAFDEVEARTAKLLGKKARSQLASPSLDLSDRSLDPVKWRIAMELSENRIGMVLSADVLAPLRCVLVEETLTPHGTPSTTAEIAEAAGPKLRQLLCFAISEEHLTLRERLGLALEE
jgi:hypothetical protein